MKRQRHLQATEAKAVCIPATCSDHSYFGTVRPRMHERRGAVTIEEFFRPGGIVARLQERARAAFGVGRKS